MKFVNVQRDCLGKKKLPWQQCIWKVCNSDSFKETRKSWAGHDEWQDNELQICPLGNIIHSSYNALMAFCNDESKVDATLKLCESVLKENPTNLIGLALQAMSHAKNDDGESARESVTQLHTAQSGPEGPRAQLEADMMVVYCWRALNPDHYLTAVVLIEEIWERDEYKRAALNTSEDSRRIQQFLNFHYGLMVYRTLHSTKDLVHENERATSGKVVLHAGTKQRILKGVASLKKFDGQQTCASYSARAAVTLCELYQEASWKDPNMKRILSQKEILSHLMQAEDLAIRHEDGKTLSRVATIWRRRKDPRAIVCLEAALSLTEKPPFCMYHQQFLILYEQWIAAFLKTHPEKERMEQKRLSKRGFELLSHLVKERYTPKDTPENLNKFKLLNLMGVMKERFKTNAICLATLGQMEYAKGSSFRTAVDLFNNALKCCATTKDEAVIHSTWASCCITEASIERNHRTIERYMGMYKEKLWKAINCNTFFVGLPEVRQALERQLTTDQTNQTSEEKAHKLVMLARLRISGGTGLDEAFKFLTRALQLSPDTPSARRWLGVCYEKSGEFQSAADEYQDLLCKCMANMKVRRTTHSHDGYDDDTEENNREMMDVLRSLLGVTEKMAETSGETASAGVEYKNYILTVLSLIKASRDRDHPTLASLHAATSLPSSHLRATGVPVTNSLATDASSALHRSDDEEFPVVLGCYVHPHRDSDMAIERFFETEAALTVDNVLNVMGPGYTIDNLAKLLSSADLFIVSIAGGESEKVLRLLNHVMMDPTLAHEKNETKFVVIGERATIFDLKVSDVLRQFFIKYWIGECLEMKSLLCTLTEKAEAGLKKTDQPEDEF